jgi:hypothetical protein
MVGVGLVYLLLAANLGSLVVVPDRVYQFYPTYDAPLDSVATAVAVDVALMVGLEFAVLGAALLWASRRPTAYAGLVPLIVALELVRGILDDVYLLTMRAYPIDAIYYGFIVLHLVVIVTGLAVYPGWRVFGTGAGPTERVT